MAGTVVAGTVVVGTLVVGTVVAGTVVVGTLVAGGLTPANKAEPGPPPLSAVPPAPKGGTGPAKALASTSTSALLASTPLLPDAAMLADPVGWPSATQPRAVQNVLSWIRIG